MRCKALQVTVELELQAITCPGVWLCPSGRVTAQIYMLNAYSQTSGMKPVFPLLCHEKFVFQKIFYEIRKLCDIERYLQKEHLYIELIQWRNCEIGNVLATFKTSLAELLYPPPWCKGAAVGVDVDLLMEATRRFPGIISPKLEVSTRTTIEEILCKCPPARGNKGGPVEIKPKPVNRKCTAKRTVPIHQKKVCHTYEYHRAKTGEPRKKIQSDCECDSDEYKTLKNVKPKRKQSACSCTSRTKYCNVCSKYENFFDEYDQSKSKSKKKVCLKENCEYYPKCSCSATDTGTDQCCPCCEGTKQKSYAINPSRECSPCGMRNKNYALDINVFSKNQCPASRTRYRRRSCDSIKPTRCISPSREKVAPSFNVNLCNCDKGNMKPKKCYEPPRLCRCGTCPFYDYDKYFQKAEKLCRRCCKSHESLQKYEKICRTCPKTGGCCYTNKKCYN